MDRNKKVIVLTNNFIGHSRKPRSKSTSIFFVALQFLLCIDYGFSTHIKIFNLKRLSHIQGAAIVMVWFASAAADATWGKQVIVDMLFLVEFAISSTMLLRSPHPSTLSFCLKQFRIIHSKMGTARDTGCEVVTFVLILIVVRIVTFVSTLSKDGELLLGSYGYAVIVVPKLFSALTPVFSCVLFTAHRHLLALNDRLRHARMSHIAFYQDMYQSSYDAIVRIHNSLSSVCVMSLMTLPRVFIVIYFEVAALNNTKTPDFASTARVCVVLGYFILIQSLPAVIAEALVRDSRAIYVTLQDRLLRTTDPLEAYRIGRFMECVRGQPFRFRLLLDFPLGTSLLAGVWSFVINYVIVVLQITHVCLD